MTAINLPSSPALNDEFTAGNRRLRFNGQRWVNASAIIDKSQVANLESDLNAKAPVSHTHTKSQITDFTHTHAVADTTGLQAALDAKAPLASPSFTGNVTIPDMVSPVNIAGGSMVSASDWATAQLEITASATGNPGFALHAPGASTVNLFHPRSTQTMQISGNAGSIDVGANKSIRNIFVNTADPSGGTDGDVWLKYTP
jgi:hypothetical protein